MKTTSARLITEVSDKLNPSNVKQIARELYTKLQKQKQLSQLDQVIDQIGNQYSQNQGRLRAKIKSSKELSAEEIAQVTIKIEGKFKRKVDLEITTEKELLGGIKVQIGDDIYDMSYAEKLSQLKQKLQGGS